MMRKSRILILGMLLAAVMQANGQKHLTIEDCVTGMLSYLVKKS